MQDNVEQLFQGEETTKERILDAAIDLISTKGFDAVSIREIARAVSIRESSIYNHFRSKDEILDTIIDYFILELTRAGEPAIDVEGQLEELGPLKFMEIGSRAYMQQINRPRVVKIWRIISIDLYRNQKIKIFFRQTMLTLPIDYWEQLFQKMMDKKLIKAYDARLLSREFFSFCIYMYFVQFFLKYDEAHPSFDEESLRELDDHVKFFMEAIKA